MLQNMRNSRKYFPYCTVKTLLDNFPRKTIATEVITFISLILT